MRLAVLSDIHSNMDALAAVLAQIQHLSIDRVISLGDNIGYGPEPGPVIQTLKSQGIFSTLGNHERALLDPAFLKSFNKSARKALLINGALMSREDFIHIQGFDLFKVFHGSRFVHGIPPDLVDRYVSKTDPARLAHIMASIKEPLSFVGHTHELAVYTLGPDGVTVKKLKKSRVFLAKTHQYIINTGSVGQPRDGYNKASFVIWDSDAGTVEPQYAAYDIPGVVKKIKKAGIPLLYAALLEKAPGLINPDSKE